MSFSIRGVEIHSHRMWQTESVRKTIDLCRQLNFNALVFHQNELLDDLVIPEECFTDAVIWDRWPLRQSRSLRRQRYINQVIASCATYGIGFYMEIKEPWFPSDIFDLKPELRSKDWKVCPTHPFWFDYVKAKVHRVIDKCPGLAGIIVSPATFETKLSITANGCGCERCKNSTPRQWYAKLIRAMFEPLSRAGKYLIVRDFAYTVGDQNDVLNACKDVSDEVIISLKAVPHDYWPTFPHNPRIGNTNGLQQWIEYDVWGQYMGCGLFPVSLIRDIRYRLKHCMQNGADGVIFRTDWEHLQDCSVMNSLNLVNLFAGGMLAQNIEEESFMIYEKYCSYGISSPLQEESKLQIPQIPQAADAPLVLEAFMEKSYDTMIATLYTRGHVTHYSSRFHHSFNFIDYVLLEHHTLEYWKPGALRDIEPTAENIEIIYREKNSAQIAYNELVRMHLPQMLGVSDALRADLETMIQLYGWYIKAFELVCHCYFDFRIAFRHSSADMAQKIHEDIAKLDRFTGAFERRMTDTNYPRYIYWVLSPETLRHFVTDIQALEGKLNDSCYVFGKYDRSRIFETQVI